MNSKEALDEIIRSFNETTTGINGLGEVVVDNCLIRCNKAELNIIKKDLDRLEILEQENQELKERIYLTHTEFEFDNLSDFRIQMRKNYIELVKLKKAIEILKDKFSLSVANEELHFDFGDYKEREISETYTELYHSLTKEEYELLKEVLCDGK